MRVVFSDESVSDEIEIVTAIILNLDAQHDPLVGDIEAILTDVFKNAAKATAFELKGKRLAADLRNGLKDEARYAAELLPQVLSLSCRHQFPIFYGAYDRNGFKKVEDYLNGFVRPYTKIWKESLHPDPAFGECLSRVNKYASNSCPKDKLLWIHDNAGHKMASKRVVLAQHRFFELLRMYPPTLTPEGELIPPSVTSFGIGPAGYAIQTPQMRVVDTIYFGDSKNSRLLQFADLCCSVIRSHLLVAHEYIEKDDNRGVLARFYSFIQDAVQNDGVPPMFSKARPWSV